MRITSNKLKDIIDFFKQELDGIYDEREIRSLIFLVMEEYTGYSSAQLLVNDDKTVSESTLLKINFAIKDLKNYKPLQYILGYATFYNLKLKVTPDVLIPRPETEELVKWIIDRNKFNRNIEPYNKNAIIKLLDIGTGSGCIAIAIKKNVPEYKVKALDISETVLKIAQHNADYNRTYIDFIKHDIFSNNVEDIKFSFDIIVSNPPYVRESEKKLMSKNVLDFEPSLALFVQDNNPLNYYEAIADFARLKLKHNGSIFLEINEALARETANVFTLKGFKSIEIRKDIHDKDRMMKIRF